MEEECLSGYESPFKGLEGQKRKGTIAKIFPDTLSWEPALTTMKRESRSEFCSSSFSHSLAVEVKAHKGELLERHKSILLLTSLLLWE
jgi:hypothetical protein